MTKYCVHERHGGVCEKTDGYCNLGACPYEEIQEFIPVRHGRWVDSDIKHAVTELLEGEYPETLTCSLCGFKHKFADEYGYSCIWHYCPNCGAKMDKEEQKHERPRVDA